MFGNICVAVKTCPSLIDTTIGKLSRGTKTLVAGGFQRVFKQSFETSEKEKLLDTFSCFLSTTSNPISGNLFVSTKRIAFLSDQPLLHYENLQQIWSYYKVMIPLENVSTISILKNPQNQLEKFIQVICHDHYDFWFLGFISPEKAIKIMQDAKIQSTKCS
ncbi:hypothetical protein KP509_32G044500 [Ceratopteris richardii]|uniref:GRAM domain-containing protein n=1 Tax=Ceratopteris richardii TaxID=49495 RepID=A0A8T2QUK6_CERRI|nr:hypothetical protein KP509_32G044500 [Ceratopteris richardii]